MSVGFRAPELEELGLAGFIRIIPDKESSSHDGLLFIINGAGEPIEFCFSTITAPRTILWGKAALKRRVAAELLKALLGACSTTPIILFARAQEIGPETFGQDVITALPTCRIATRLDAFALEIGDQEESVPDDEDIQLIWSGDAPMPDTSERRLFERLVHTGLLLEPFERAEAGLSEVRRSEADT